jgi:BirA family biotin operon repressor/biotin-[acetyl-CoA-carboxylase] ligase
LKRIPSKERKLKICLAALESWKGDLYYYDTVTSTMDVAFNLDTAGLKDRTLVIADIQTAGRGRYERKWHATPQDLLFSLILTEYDFRIPYSMIAAFAVYTALKKHTKRVHLKWINDVLWKNGKKIAGVLTEEARKRTVIGIGVNLNTAVMPPPLRVSATSYYIETGKKVGKERFLGELLTKMFTILEKAERGGLSAILSEWETISDLRGRKVRINQDNQVFAGTVIGLNKATGSLLVDCDGIEKEVYEGSVVYQNPSD